MSTKKPTAATAATTNIEGFAKLDEIRPSPLNPRKSFAAESIEQLGASIAEQGLLQRLLVRPIGSNGKPPELKSGKWVGLSHFELVDGERRFRALAHNRTVGRGEDDKIPVVVRWLSDAESLAVMLVANDQREDVRPSEQAAGYARLRAELATDEAVATAVGKPLAFVRSILRLAKLPAWALAAVDAGTLPRATAELVARVPGEENRKKCAACVITGVLDPCFIQPVHMQELESLGVDPRADLKCANAEPLSYRETKDLIRNYFQVELKGCPFDRKSLDLLPEAGSCEACPKRAGNDAEAIAEKVRADVCLDPDCYRQKVEAYRAREIAKAQKKGMQLAEVEIVDLNRQPRGWLFVDSQLQHCGSELDLAGVSHVKAERKLSEFLKDTDTPLHLAFGPNHKPVVLAKTADARKALIEAKVLKKPEKREPVKAERSTPAASDKPVKSGPSSWEVDHKAIATAAGVLREYTQEECSALDEHEDAHADGPIRGALELSLRAVAYELSRSREGEKLLRQWVVPDGDFDTGLDAAICAMTPSQMLGLLVAVAAAMELFDGPNRPTGESLLAFAELDWPQLQDQARRELTGGEAAETKIAKAVAK